MKPRILVTIVGQGSIIHIIRTGLAERMKSFCEPVFVIQWDQPDLIAELREKNFEVHILPPSKFTREYIQLRLKINNWYYKKILRSPSRKIEQQLFAQFWSLKKKIKVKMRRGAQDFIQNFIPGYIGSLIKKEKKMLANEAAYLFFEQWLTSLNVQGLFTVTPFLHEVEMAARILNNRKLPVIASVHSFDNITKRSWPAFFFDHYIVWNKYNKDELKRINPRLKESDISIAGPPQFDFHFNDYFFQTKKEWLNDFGLPENKKIVLYSGSSGDLFRNEPQYLKHLGDAIENGKINKDVIILFRQHPLDKIDRWQKYVGKSKSIFFKESQNSPHGLDFANVTMHNISQFISTLKYCDIHVNLCSTMAVDGSVFNKPQIGPFYDDIVPQRQNLLRNMYFQEHYLPIIKSKTVHLAHSKKQLIDLVNKTLEHPEEFNKECRHCVEEIITYTDGRSTERVAAILKKFFSR